MSDTSFALLHPGVQKAIWAMKWEQFRPIQVESIHRILQDSCHLIISAQTASGKTEAAFIPIISKLAENIRPSVQALYIGPLKALINDQFARLEKLCGYLEIPVHRWHGDVSASSKKELRHSPSGILLITPESLESNFINYGSQIPRIYKNLEYVVIDELHSFLNNVRGVHLLSLLSRLTGISGTAPRLIALSATLGDPQAACQFLSPDRPENVKIILDPNAKREIRFGIRTYLSSGSSEDFIEPRLSAFEALQVAEHLSGYMLLGNPPCTRENSPELTPILKQADDKANDELDEIAEDIMQHFTGSTNLIFVNSKKTIENLSAKLRERVKEEKLAQDPFVVHHGSISKELREEAEIQLKSGVPTTAICSSTLEMGIDISSVHAVGQVDTPWSVASMVQRLGRSGRNEGDAAIMREYVREASPNFGSDLTDLLYPNLLRAIALTRLMLRKWLEPPDTDRMHASTLVHQILSCLKQTGGLSAQKLNQILTINGPFRLITPNLFKTILRDLGHQKIIEQMPQGDLILAPLGERITSSFDFYAAFKATDEYFVRNAQEDIGTLPATSVPPVGEIIILAGRRWKVDEIDNTNKSVFVSPARGGKAPEFESVTGEFHTQVMREVQAILMENDEPAWLDQNSKLLLRASRCAASKSGLLRTGVLVRPHHIQWFPWIGSRGFETLRAFARYAKLPHQIDHLSITYALSDREAFLQHLKTICTTSVTAPEVAALLPIKAVQKFDGLLSYEVLDIVNGHDRLNLDEAKDTAQLTLSNLTTRAIETGVHP